MFCKNCGEQLEDDAKFCPSCGQPNLPVQSAVQSHIQEFNYQNMNQSVTPRTNYASTSFNCAIWGSVLILLCGIGLFVQPFTLLFGILALKNKELETAKAWIGTIIGSIGTVIVSIIIYRWMTDGI